jgi:hypothetical protein
VYNPLHIPPLQSATYSAMQGLHAHQAGPKAMLSSHANNSKQYTCHTQTLYSSTAQFSSSASSTRHSCKCQLGVASLPPLQRNQLCTGPSCPYITTTQLQQDFALPDVVHHSLHKHLFIEQVVSDSHSRCQLGASQRPPQLLLRLHLKTQTCKSYFCSSSVFARSQRWHVEALESSGKGCTAVQLHLCYKGMETPNECTGLLRIAKVQG